MKKVAIIGAGMGGLACAHYLQKFGLKPTLYEKLSHAGGRTQTISKDSLVFDSGAQFFTNYYDCIEELGGEMEKLCFRPREMIHLYSPNQMIHLNFGGFQTLSIFQKVYLLSLMAFLRFKSRNMNHFDPQKKIIPKYEIRADLYLKKFFNDHIINDYIDVLCFSIIGVGLKHLSAQAFLELLGKSQFYFFENGFSSLYEKLAKEVSIQFKEEISSVNASKDGVEVHSESGVSLYDLVVLAVPGKVAQKIYKNPTSNQHQVLETCSYVPMIGIAFSIPIHLYDQKPVILISIKESPIISVILSKQLIKTGSKNAKPENIILSVFLHNTPSQKWADHMDQEISQFVKNELVRLFPTFEKFKDQIMDFAVQKWQYANPISLSPHMKNVAAFWEKGQGEQNVYFVGDYLNAAQTEGSVRTAKVTAEMIAKSSS